MRYGVRVLLSAWTGRPKVGIEGVFEENLLLSAHDIRTLQTAPVSTTTTPNHTANNSGFRTNLCLSAIRKGQNLIEHLWRCLKMIVLSIQSD